MSGINVLRWRRNNCSKVGFYEVMKRERNEGGEGLVGYLRCYSYGRFPTIPILTLQIHFIPTIVMIKSKDIIMDKTERKLDWTLEILRRELFLTLYLWRFIFIGKNKQKMYEIS